MKTHRNILLLTGAAAACALAAWLWAFWSALVLPAWLARGLETAAAGAMIWQGGKLSPRLAVRKNNGRMLMKPRTMEAGSLALFAGAALILAGDFQFCVVANRSASGPGSAWRTRDFDKPKPPRDSQPQYGRPESSAAIPDSGPLDRCCVAQTAPAHVRRAEQTVAPEQVTK